jgi:2,4-dienoyl-CoA reductase-like NADH-dependent reductase (Old Yellow Enzyme family)
MTILFEATRISTVAPSVLPDTPYPTAGYRAASEEDIWEIVRSFGDAALRAREAGFDAVQIHGAHAYLLSQFLSPHTNRRDDDWGGTLENRLRLHREMLRDMRGKAGDDYPMLIKIGVADEVPGGLELAEGRQAVQLLEHWGYDAVEVSQGLRGRKFDGMEFRTGINSLEREGYFANGVGRLPVRQGWLS